ncbi:unnamed protein product [Tilletia laevis]|uniref:Uncharacterized protein n=3 Tax=Tilletia TaxID=13289 RepID=A0A8X7T116_9BASI|nr:hypothetical protein CF336_g471 [Tilletia laevis]KAE8201106.1 hypothetical protein CF328_g2779 [Tilletia controversa]KAE8265411.1 hypothetical protein A4X03_0g280 [Tilletia caries]KAE8255240.1 hypothetical protein A4X06_0g536 [Tilletia controversa]CAD6916427.1 unnamed protein product [Tilletia laevis]
MSTSSPPRRLNTFPTNFTALLLLDFLLTSSLSPTHAARISNNTTALPPLQHDPLERISYRTFQAGDTQGAEFNVSTYTMDTGLASRTRSPSGIYGCNFIWRGEAYDPSGPLMVWFGSSASRCNDVSDPTCVLSKGLFEGWPQTNRRPQPVHPHPPHRRPPVHPNHPLPALLQHIHLLPPFQFLRLARQDACVEASSARIGLGNYAGC